MHQLQADLLKLASEKNIGAMTLRDIGKEIGEKFPQKVKHHLDQLQKKGLIKIDKENNLVELIQRGDTKNTNLYSIPVLGAANCGPASLYADEAVQGYLKISKDLLPAKKDSLFAVKARGTSMNLANINGKNIEDDDYIIVDGSDLIPETNKYVLSVIDGAANVKKMIMEDNRIVLMSESYEDFPPIVIHSEDEESYNYVINGRVVDVVKLPRAKATR